jgi:cob(I)alamin adenosyltransferase
MKIYTRTGDGGTTSLAGGTRVPKYHIRIEAYGTIDELISWIGLLRDFRENDARRETLKYIQDQLMRCAATLASEKRDPKLFVPEPDPIAFLEDQIDKMETVLPSISNFVLPGGHVLVSYCHIARCVCRRAERAVLRLNDSEKVPETVYVFLNRLADYLYVLSRYIGYELDIEEDKWSV